MIEIRETKKIALKRPVLIEGFPGVGMIGTAATMYLVKELNMEMCGYFVSDKFPPFCMIHDGVPLPPVRIYKSDKHNLLLILSEFAIPLSSVYEVCCKMMDWAKARDVRTIYSLGGISMAVPEKEIDRVFGVATTTNMKKVLEKHGITTIREGVTTGATGTLLAYGYAEGIPIISLLTPSRSISIDLVSAAAVLDSLIKIEKLPVSTKKLLTEGRKLEAKIKEVLKRVKEASTRYQKLEKYTPTYR